MPTTTERAWTARQAVDLVQGAGKTPYFNDEELRFFGQRKSSFKIKKVKDKEGRTRWILWGPGYWDGRLMGFGVCEFLPDERTVRGFHCSISTRKELEKFWTDIQDHLKEADEK